MEKEIPISVRDTGSRDDDVTDGDEAASLADAATSLRNRFETRCRCLTIGLFTLFIFSLFARPATPQEHRDWEEARLWVNAPDAAPRLGVSRAVEEQIWIDATEEGAVGDGVTDNTRVLQDALDRCPGSRLCVIHFPRPGSFLTGHLSVRKSGVTLHVDFGAALQFIAQAQLYPKLPYPEYPNKPSYPPPPNGCHSALLTVRNVDHFSITGGGVIDGNGEYHVWDHVPPVSMIYALNADYVTVRNITVKDPAVIALHAQFSQHVLFEDVDITVSGDTREEGLLIDSCKYVTVRRLRYGGRGLGFVLASGDGVEGRSVRLPNMHILLEHSYFSGGVVMVSAMAGGNFNVTYRYLELKIHARPDITGGESRDILMEHIRGVNLHHLIVIDMTRQLPDEMRHKRLNGDREEEEYAPVARIGVGGVLPVIHNVIYRNISATGIDSDAFKIRTLSKSPVTGIMMEGVHASGRKAVWKCKGGAMHGSAVNVSPVPPKDCLRQ